MTELNKNIKNIRRSTIKRLKTSDGCTEYFGKLGDTFLLDLNSVHVVELTNVGTNVKHEKAIVYLCNESGDYLRKDGNILYLPCELFFPEDNLVKLVQHDDFARELIKLGRKAQ